MASRENLPKIIVDVQDIVSQLASDFESSKEPITDDNHSLHKLCAKLEFLLTSSVKERSLLGSRRSYWHWVYACLKSTHGLSDGLRYVQANKEIQTSKGRGRAFIRYCLVHQTLADSLQNCIMNQVVASQYINSNSILLNPTHSSIFITALYDLNAVYFDLNAKGYDLDAGWPTFASKRTSPPIEQWAIRGRVESLGSLTTASVMMESPRLHGSSSSGPHSVDHRVEELVLELDQSDQKIKQQEEVILELESKADMMVKSTNEKEDILARVISDLESKNRHLHDAMSHMSSEFQERDQQWREKYDKVTKEKNWFETNSKTLISKISQLEDDKRTLEELVSQQMSDITRNFSSDISSEMLTPVTSATEVESFINSDERKLQKSNYVDASVSDELNGTAAGDEVQMRLNKDVMTLKVETALNLQLEEMRENLSLMEEKYSKLLSTYNLLKKAIQSALLLNDVSDENMINAVVDAASKLNQPHISHDETNQQESDVTEFDSHLATSLKQENESLVFDRDEAQQNADKHKLKLSEVELQVEELKVELESIRSCSAHRIIELEEQLSLSEQQCENQKRHQQEMLADLKVAQDDLKVTKEELEIAKTRCQQLEQSERTLHDELEKTKQEYEDELNDNEFAIEELQAEMRHHASISESLDHNLELEKVKSSKLNSELVIAQEVVRTFTDNLDKTRVTLDTTEQTISQLQVEMKRLTQMDIFKEKQINYISHQVEGFFECIRLIDEGLDVGEFKLQESSEDILDEEGKAAIADWKISQTNFVHVLKKYQSMKSGLTTLEKEYYTLSDESQSHRCSDKNELEKLREELAENQATIEIHLIKVKDLSDQQKVLQDNKAENLDRISKLEYNLQDVSQSLEGSRHVADDLRLKIMESSAREVKLQDKVQAQNFDIECLKEKITQLLLDKDMLWKDTEVLRDRLSQSYESCNKSELDISNVSLVSSTAGETPGPPHKEFEEIASDECCSVLDHGEGTENDSMSQAESPQQHVNNEYTVTISAGKEMHLPVYIEHPNTTLHWDISSNRDINFKLNYAQTEDDALQELVPTRNIDSHIEPFIGELTAKREGIYTLVLDNKFSRFMSKTVTYKLKIVSSAPLN